MDQTTVARLWATTQREALIDSGPPPAATNSQPASVPEQKVKQEPAKK